MPKDQHFAIGSFIADGLAGRDINVKADRRLYRSYMYLDGLVEWLMSLANNTNLQSPIYNVASDDEVEMGALAGIIADILNVEVAYAEGRMNLVDRYIPSVEKSNNGLGLRNSNGLK